MSALNNPLQRGKHGLKMHWLPVCFFKCNSKHRVAHKSHVILNLCYLKIVFFPKVLWTGALMARNSFLVSLCLLVYQIHVWTRWACIKILRFFNWTDIVWQLSALIAPALQTNCYVCARRLGVLINKRNYKKQKFLCINNIISKFITLTFSGSFRGVYKRQKLQSSFAAILQVHRDSKREAVAFQYWMATWPANSLPISALPATTFLFTKCLQNSFNN